MGKKTIERRGIVGHDINEDVCVCVCARVYVCVYSTLIEVNVESSIRKWSYYA